MADTQTTQLPQYEDFLAKIQAWMETTAQGVAAGTDRDWCTLDMDSPMTEENLAIYFDRTALGDKYTEEYNKTSDAGPPFAFLQMESDLIYSMHKCFATRHRGRLMTYKDDCTQKDFRAYNALSLAAGKYAQMKNSADKLVQWPQA